MGAAFCGLIERMGVVRGTGDTWDGSGRAGLSTGAVAGLGESGLALAAGDLLTMGVVGVRVGAGEMGRGAGGVRADESPAAWAAVGEALGKLASPR